MNRSPMQVDDDFRKRMKKIQKDIMRKKGEFEGIPSITRRMNLMPELDLIERKLLGEVNQINFKINFDKRGKR